MSNDETVFSEKELQTKISDLESKAEPELTARGIVKEEIMDDSMTNSDLENEIEYLGTVKNNFEGIIKFKSYREMEEKLKEVELNSSTRNECEASQYEIDNLEITTETLSENRSGLIISELEEKLKEAVLHNNLIKQELNVCQAEAQKTNMEHEKCIQSLAVEKRELKNAVCQLQEKLKEAERNDNLMRAKIHVLELQLQKSRDISEKREIECLTSKIKEYESMVHELREKLADAQLHLPISARDKSNGEPQKIQVDAEVASPISGRGDEQDAAGLRKEFSELAAEISIPDSEYDQSGVSATAEPPMVMITEASSLTGSLTDFQSASTSTPQRTNQPQPQLSESAKSMQRVTRSQNNPNISKEYETIIKNDLSPQMSKGCGCKKDCTSQQCKCVSHKKPCNIYCTCKNGCKNEFNVPANTK